MYTEGCLGSQRRESRGGLLRIHVHRRELAVWRNKEARESGDVFSPCARARGEILCVGNSSRAVCMPRSQMPRKCWWVCDVLSHVTTQGRRATKGRGPPRHHAENLNCRDRPRQRGARNRNADPPPTQFPSSFFLLTGRAGGCPKRKCLTPFGACCALGKVPRTTSHRTSVQGVWGIDPFVRCACIRPNRVTQDGGKKIAMPYRKAVWNQPGIEPRFPPSFICTSGDT